MPFFWSNHQHSTIKILYKHYSLQWRFFFCPKLAQNVTAVQFWWGFLINFLKIIFNFGSLWLGWYILDALPLIPCHWCYSHSVIWGEKRWRLMAKIGHKILVASQTQLALFASSFFFSFSEAHSSKVIMVHQNSKGLLTSVLKS